MRRKQKRCGCVFFRLRDSGTGKRYWWQVVWCPDHAQVILEDPQFRIPRRRRHLPGWAGTVASYIVATAIFLGLLWVFLRAAMAGGGRGG